jgi:ribosome assembly protein YihI (activator of Der GTPase)
MPADKSDVHSEALNSQLASYDARGCSLEKGALLIAVQVTEAQREQVERRMAVLWNLHRGQSTEGLEDDLRLIALLDSKNATQKGNA